MGLLPKQAVVIVAVGIFCVGIAHAEIMTKVGGVRSLLISALTAPDGTASGTVEGREGGRLYTCQNWRDRSGQGRGVNGKAIRQRTRMRPLGIETGPAEHADERRHAAGRGG